MAQNYLSAIHMISIEEETLILQVRIKSFCRYIATMKIEGNSIKLDFLKPDAGSKKNFRNNTQNN